MLKKWRRKGDEENFDEALAQAYRVWSPSGLPADVAALLTEPSVTQVSHNVSFPLVPDPNSQSKNLHLLLHGLNRFIATAHLPPVSPSLPDMHSSTKTYVTLQNIYKEQYQADLAKFTTILASVLAEAELPPDTVPASEIESFVKNIGGVDVIKGSSLVQAKTAKAVGKGTGELEKG
jgi:amyloid beta precursor protein binding protein 1